MRFGGQFTYIQLNVAYGAYAQAVEQLGGSVQDSFNDLTERRWKPDWQPAHLFSTQGRPSRQTPLLANPLSDI